LKRENLARANKINEKLKILETQLKVLESNTGYLQISIKAKTYDFMDVELCETTRQQIEQMLVNNIIRKQAELEIELDSL